MSKKLLYTVLVESNWDEYSATETTDHSEHESPHEALKVKKSLNDKYEKDCRDHLYAYVAVSYK